MLYVQLAAFKKVLYQNRQIKFNSTQSIAASEIHTLYRYPAY